MQQGHKQRLIGAVVVVALAVIFLPMLLQGPVERDTRRVDMEIPERPQPDAEAEGREQPEPDDRLEAVPVPEEPGADEDPVETTGDAPPPDAAAEAESGAAEGAADPDDAGGTETAAGDADAAASTEASGADNQAAEGGWSVQVGSFADQSNAERLSAELREAGYTVRVRSAQTGGDTRYRVQVGAEPGREAAAALRDELADEYGYEGLVRSPP